MRKLSSHLGQIASEVKSFIDERLTLAHVRAFAGHMVDTLLPPQSLSQPAQALETEPTSAPVMTAGLTLMTWSGIRFLEADGCDMCARPFEGGLWFGAGSLCSGCAEKPFPFRRGRAACLYDEASKPVILGFKHADRLDYAPMLSRWLERAAGELLREADVIIPVPLHRLRLFERRYNQAAEIARPLAQRNRLTYLPDSLQRIRMTKHQKAGADARWENVRGAFSVTTQGQKRISGKRVLLVDDVFTTGATLRACTDALLKGGAVSVDVVVLARVLPTVSV